MQQPQIVWSHSKVVGICWPCPCCKMWRGQAKYKRVLDFKKHEMVSAEREAREHAVAVLHSVSQGTPAVMDGCQPLRCPPRFLRSHRWRSHLCGSQPPAVPGRKKKKKKKRLVIQYILDTHKLSNGAKAENVNAGPSDN